LTSDDTVEVGAALYEIDTEAEASVTASVEAAPTKKQPVVAAPLVAQPAAAAAVEETSSHRAPSIKFLGKEGWLRLRSSHAEAAVVVFVIPPNYGRPKFTEEEMEALITGGANLSPDVKRQSSGAIFGY
jgi:pyruvate/2-oxoglutarate dehydrogenase complex dihydrolipoamide acyltransferase (E2) component